MTLNDLINQSRFTASIDQNHRNVALEKALRRSGATLAIACAGLNPVIRSGRLHSVTDASGTERFLYDGNALIMEFDAGGGILARHVHGLSAGDDPLASYTGSLFDASNEQLIRQDRLGSVLMMSTDRTATTVTANTYDEYGVPGSNNVGRFQYTGQVWLPQLGLYHYKARMYSPTLGRFLQTDPIGYGDGMNMYAYVGNDPVNGIDPFGLKEGDACTTEGGDKGKETKDGECAIQVVITARTVIKVASGGGFYAGFGGRYAPGNYALRFNRENIRLVVKEPQKEQDPCALALQQGGQIEYGGNTGTLVALAGFEGSWGKWRNLKTGSHGSYFSVGGGVGAGIGLTRDYGKVRSLADFVGYGETASGSVSIGPVSGGYSATQNAAGDWVSSGGSVGYSPSVLSSRRLGASATATAGETFIRSCHVHGN